MKVIWNGQIIPPTSSPNARSALYLQARGLGPLLAGTAHFYSNDGGSLTKPEGSGSGLYATTFNVQPVGSLPPWIGDDSLGGPFAQQLALGTFHFTVTATYTNTSPYAYLGINLAGGNVYPLRSSTLSVTSDPKTITFKGDVNNFSWGSELPFYDANIFLELFAKMPGVVAVYEATVTVTFSDGSWIDYAYNVLGRPENVLQIRAGGSPVEVRRIQFIDNTGLTRYGAYPRDEPWTEVMQDGAVGADYLPYQIRLGYQVDEITPTGVLRDAYDVRPQRLVMDPDFGTYVTDDLGGHWTHVLGFPPWLYSHYYIPNKDLVVSYNVYAGIGGTQPVYESADAGNTWVQGKGWLGVAPGVVGYYGGFGNGYLAVTGTGLAYTSDGIRWHNATPMADAVRYEGLYWSGAYWFIVALTQNPGEYEQLHVLRSSNLTTWTEIALPGFPAPWADGNVDIFGGLSGAPRGWAHGDMLCLQVGIYGAAVDAGQFSGEILLRVSGTDAAYEVPDLGTSTGGHRRYPNNVWQREDGLVIAAAAVFNDPTDTSIHMFYSEDDGHTWSQASVPYPLTATTNGNAGGFLFDDESGHGFQNDFVMLVGGDAAHAGLVRSTDGGRTYEHIGAAPSDFVTFNYSPLLVVPGNAVLYFDGPTMAASLGRKAVLFD